MSYRWTNTLDAMVLAAVMGIVGLAIGGVTGYNVGTDTVQLPAPPAPATVSIVPSYTSSIVQADTQAFARFVNAVPIAAAEALAERKERAAKLNEALAARERTEAMLFKFDADAALNRAQYLQDEVQEIIAAERKDCHGTKPGETFVGTPEFWNSGPIVQQPANPRGPHGEPTSESGDPR